MLTDAGSPAKRCTPATVRQRTWRRIAKCHGMPYDENHSHMSHTRLQIRQHIGRRGCTLLPRTAQFLLARLCAAARLPWTWCRNATRACSACRPVPARANRPCANRALPYHTARKLMIDNHRPAARFCAPCCHMRRPPCWHYAWARAATSGNSSPCSARRMPRSGASAWPCRCPTTARATAAARLRRPCLLITAAHPCPAPHSCMSHNDAL